MRVPTLLNEITEFWYSRRVGTDVPDWTHFSPHTHTRFLPHIILWEVVEDSYLARITGETVSEMLPVRLANRRLHDVLTDDLAPLPEELDRAVQSGVPIYADRPGAWTLEDETVHYQAVHLPFFANHGATDRVLTVMSFTTEHRVDI